MPFLVGDTNEGGSVPLPHAKPAPWHRGWVELAAITCTRAANGVQHILARLQRAHVDGRIKGAPGRNSSWWRSALRLYGHLSALGQGAVSLQPHLQLGGGGSAREQKKKVNGLSTAWRT